MPVEHECADDRVNPKPSEGKRNTMGTKKTSVETAIARIDRENARKAAAAAAAPTTSSTEKIITPAAPAPEPESAPATAPAPAPGAVARIERAAKRAKRAVATVPAYSDPRMELQRLVQSHVALTKGAVAIEHMASDRKNHKTGETIRTRIPVDSAAQMLAQVKELRRSASLLETPMLRELRKIPIYQTFLSRVYGVGPVVAAYLVSDIDIHRAVKPSALRMFCGLAVVDGRLVRRTAGVKNRYNANLRTRIFQMFSAMAKNGAKVVAGRPNGTTNKYLEVWNNVKHREMHSERINVADNKWRDADGEWRGGARAHAHSKGWHKAADVFIEDLYIVWRALEGLVVWPGYYAAKLGYAHGGDPVANAPKLLSVEEALAAIDVASVEGSPAARRMELPAPTSDNDDESQAADEAAAEE